MKKRKQHYVSQFYLKPWETNGQLFCLRNGSIFKTSTINIGQQRDFYRLKELTDQDVTNIKLLISKMPVSSQAMHQTWINFFNLIFDFKNFLRSKNAITPEIDAEIDIEINNFEENLHVIIEGTGASYIKKLLNSDTSFYNNIKCREEFCYFLSVQYFRTNRMRTRMIATFNQRSLNIPQEFIDFVPNMERCWGVLSHMFAANVGFALSQMPLMLLHNKSETPLITSDQPAINLKSTYDITKHPEEFELYYPLSPRVAVVLTEGTTNISKNLQSNDVIMLNNALAASSLEQIYANQEDVLKQYMN